MPYAPHIAKRFSTVASVCVCRTRACRFTDRMARSSRLLEEHLPKQEEVKGSYQAIWVLRSAPKSREVLSVTQILHFYHLAKCPTFCQSGTYPVQQNTPTETNTYLARLTLLKSFNNLHTHTHTHTHLHTLTNSEHWHTHTRTPLHTHKDTARPVHRPRRQAALEGTNL